MRRPVLRPVAAGILLLLGAAGARAREAAPPLGVRDVRLEAVGPGRRVTIVLSREPEGIHGSRLDDPLRLEIDLDGQAEPGPERTFPVTDDVVGAVRAVPRPGGLRLVIDLRRDPGPSNVSGTGTEVVADLGEAPVTRPSVTVGLVGKRLRLTGRWVEQHLEASRLEPRNPYKEMGSGRVTGQIDALGPAPQTARVGPLVVEWTRSTRFVKLSPDKLVPGAWIEAKGPLAAPGRVIAERIEASTPGPVEIQGAVTAEERRTDGSTALTVLGIEAVVPVGIPTVAFELAYRPDQRRPDVEHSVSLFGRPLTVGAYVRSRSQYRRNFDLENHSGDDEFDLNNRLHLEALYRITPRVLLFASGRAVYSFAFELNEGKRKDEREFVRRESWLFVGDVAQSVLGRGYSLQIGRQKIREERRWWWRRNLDAARVYYDRPRLHLEVAVAEELVPDGTKSRFTDPDHEGVLRTFGQAAWAWGQGQRLDVFFLSHFDHSGQHSIGLVIPNDKVDSHDARLLWLGPRASGEVDWGSPGTLFYGLDAAWMGGKERVFDFKDVDEGHERLSSKTSHNVGGFAVDARAIWATTVPGRPMLGFDYAFGSGNSAARHGLDTGFRQTGLGRNRDVFLGAENIRYYGELLRPELSNLHIFTAGVGFRMLRSSSIEFLYHFYRQAVPAPFLRDVRIDADPTGKSSLIGHEWDISLALREWEKLEVQLIPAIFLAGPAFGSFSGNLAESVLLRVKYSL